MTCSLTFCSSKTAKNGPKWPKRPKTAKNGQKTVKNSIFFLDFFLLIFFLLCRHFICCSLKQLKMPQNGQNGPKQQKTAFFTVFFDVKNLPPGGKSHFPWWDFSEIFSVCSQQPELKFHRLGSLGIAL